MFLKFSFIHAFILPCLFIYLPTSMIKYIVMGYIASVYGAFEHLALKADTTSHFC